MYILPFFSSFFYLYFSDFSFLFFFWLSCFFCVFPFFFSKFSFISFSLFLFCFSHPTATNIHKTEILLQYKDKYKSWTGNWKTLWRRCSLGLSRVPRTISATGSSSNSALAYDLLFLRINLFQFAADSHASLITWPRRTFFRQPLSIPAVSLEAHVPNLRAAVNHISSIYFHLRTLHSTVTDSKIRFRQLLLIGRKRSSVARDCSPLTVAIWFPTRPVLHVCDWFPLLQNS